MQAFLSKVKAVFTGTVAIIRTVHISVPLTFIAAGLFAYGTALLSVPAGIMAGGVLLFLIAVDMRT